MQIINKNIYFLLFVFLSLKISAQSESFSYPVKIPVFLSANFCELRPNHFHGGIDIKTEQRIGVPMYAAMEGFIYRIVVSPGGYGNALYIEHPNGKSTVYGHLDRFRDDIQAYVKEEQYRQKSFAVDLSPDKEQFRIEKEELIAFGGNSGSSGGPHLHFEIRDTPTQDALNPLAFYPDIRDNIPPRIYSVLVYPLSETGHVNFASFPQKYQVAGSGNSFSLAKSPQIEVYGKIGIAVNTNDFYDGSHNPCGIYSAELKVDDNLIFAFTFDRMPFSDTRYMNSHIDYSESVDRGTRIHRMWQLPGNQLKIYRKDLTNGIFDVEDGQNRKVELVLSDLAGNTSTVRFTLKGSFREIRKPEMANSRFFPYDEENFLVTPDLEFFAPKGAFYDDFYFRYDSLPRATTTYSALHQIHNDGTPVHDAVTLRIKTTGLPEHSIGKAFIAKISVNGYRSYSGGKYSDGWFTTETRTLGRYAVVADTIPPVIN
ncbi:MAG TPA: hypothetical protein DCY25_06270, partial [Bacteroidales bacterium]|nr:hypothetical protein [Bacteroidales bacterium]